MTESETFCSGVVKVTPAHDHNDYEVGLRHNLAFITCFTDDGNMSEQCGEFKVFLYPLLAKCGKYQNFAN